jgi:transcription elongation factor GreA
MKRCFTSAPVRAARPRTDRSPEDRPVSADAPTSTRTPPVLTSAGRAWLQARYDRITDRLDRIGEELGNERSHQLVVEQQQLLEQVEALGHVLREAVAPGDLRDDPSIVEVGDEVEVEFPDGSTEAFRIVHPVEAGMDEHRTSMDAPLAAAVLGHRPGDRVTVTAPAGVYSCTIVRRDRLE